MKYFKGLFLLLIFTVFSFTIHAQLVRDLYKLYNPAYFYDNQSDTSSFEPWNTFPAGKANYSFEVGTSFSSFGSGAGLSTSYISPIVSFMATERLHVVAGGRFSYANANNAMIFNSEFGQAPHDGAVGNPTEAFAYGNYQVNERLNIYGMGAFGKNQLYMSPFHQGINTADYQQVSFGMNYQLTEKTSIGASFGFSNRPAWGVSPFGGSRHHGFSPFFP